MTWKMRSVTSHTDEEGLVIWIRRKQLFLAVRRLLEAISPLYTTPGRGHLIGSRPDNMQGRGASDDPYERRCSIIEDTGFNANDAWMIA